MLCSEEWGLSTEVINLDKANWFLLGLGATHILAFLRKLILLQCMTGWCILLAKAAYIYFIQHPKKPPKNVPTDISLTTPKQPIHYEQWRHFHPSAKVRKRKRSIKTHKEIKAEPNTALDVDDAASNSDDDSCVPAPPPVTNFYIDGRLSFAFNPSQQEPVES